VARELFLDRGGGQDRERQNRESEIKVFTGFGAFLSRKQAFSKKKSSPDLERFFVPKMAQDTGLRGATAPLPPLLSAPMIEFDFF